MIVTYVDWPGKGYAFYYSNRMILAGYTDDSFFTRNRINFFRYMGEASIPMLQKQPTAFWRENYSGYFSDRLEDMELEPVDINRIYR